MREERETGGRRKVDEEERSENEKAEEERGRGT